MKLHYLLPLMLTACATTNTNSLSGFAKADATAALQLATAAKDQSGITCYTAVNNAIDTLNAAPFTPGVLYLAEKDRLAKQQAGFVAAACSDVFNATLVP